MALAGYVLDDLHMKNAAWDKAVTSVQTLFPDPAPDPSPDPSPAQSTLETTSHDIIWGMLVVFAAGVLIVAFLALASRKKGGGDESKELSEQIRALGGLLAVIAADGAVIIAAVWAVGHFGNNADSNVAVLSAGFSAVTAITTAYLSIKAISNTARTAMHHAQQRRDDNPNPAGGGLP
ncbi:hypothetical protein [Streptomyces sp. NPDC047000]|uniref:hypothetical protein n=1 Tax=Streptomyces sp. NPDC047000 TaxID=3155474 RepID=UPI0033C79AEC